MKLLVNEEDKNKRLDIFLFENIQTFSRSHIKNMIESGNVLINGKAIKKAGEKIKTGQTVEYTNIEVKPISADPQDIDFEIIYEDDDLLVINKPQNLVVHPCSSTKDGTLVNGLLYKVKNLSGINGKLRPGIVHRLDKNTSGVMLVAKNDFAHVNLSEQIKNKTCKRTYIALLNGNLKDDEGEVTTYIARDKKDRKKMAVSTSGRIAITEFKVIKRYLKFCLVRFDLKTGRTHQIRVHSKYLGCSVVGDDVYGKPDKNLNGQLLHSMSITFTHPRTNKVMSFSTPLPSYFSEYLDKIAKTEIK